MKTKTKEVYSSTHANRHRYLIRSIKLFSMFMLMGALPSSAQGKSPQRTAYSVSTIHNISNSEIENVYKLCMNRPKFLNLLLINEKG